MLVLYFFVNGGYDRNQSIVGGTSMKKKVLVLLVVAVLAVAPAMAASYRGSAEEGSVGVGINLGTNTGLGLKFGMGKFDIFADVGLDAWHIGSDGVGLGGDVGVSYEVYDIDLGGKHHMPVTVGLMFPLGFVIHDNGFDFDLGVAVQAGLEYQIPDVPLSFYLRLGVGPGFTFGSSGFHMYPAWSAALGMLYVF